MKKIAQFYKIEDGRIRCNLCPQNCLIAEGNKGRCRVRQAERHSSGKLRLYTMNYGEVTSIALDPIEKKPLTHFCPGTNILSIGSYGCNLGCKFCQNHVIAHGIPKSQYYSPRDIVDILKRFPDSIGIAFTYNEPSIWYEYVYDTAVAIKKVFPDKKVVLVTNGYISEEPLRKLLPYVDALNIDLKGDNEFYQEVCGGQLEHVRRTIEIAYEEGCHVEITTLLIDGLNTSKEQLLELGYFLRETNPESILHITRYFPNYEMELPPTSFEELKKAYEFLKEMLPNVEVGNISELEKVELQR